MAIHARTLRQRLIVEELFRSRRATDQERYVETFRRAAVDPNPHQVEAVSFALDRIPRGGALLCDEVGLGKTIETGLLLTQMRADGRGHILIVVPVALARQWQVELKDLFGLKAISLGKDNFDRHTQRGIYIVGREFATTPKWAVGLAERGPWDLVVVDEAHEILSGIHERFSKRDGSYQTNPRKGKARRAAILKQLVGSSPVLVLTATPLQNSLLEMWGLVHFVDHSSAVLGNLDQFIRLFAVAEGRGVNPDTAQELRTRLSSVVCRTLRSQAQPFLRTPFTARQCQTVNFHLEATERELYEGVSEWLSGRTAAYRPRHKGLMTLMLRRRMGSSVAALAGTLSAVRKRLDGEDPEEVRDWEYEEEVATEVVENDLRELRRLENLAQRALKERSPKLERLWDLIEEIGNHAREGVSSDKLVIFTESKKTLDSIVEFLEARGLKGQVTAFSGQNDSFAAHAAVARWELEVGRHLDPTEHPDRSASVRAALVHEFRTRSRVFVATESGAKGLNLQFCNCLVNFDLPWNPQRVEQRIGRVHRYGQQHDVVIINFINLDNEGEVRVYELLRDKLQLFEGLFGSSDEVLGQTSSVLNFEKRVNDLLSNCRTAEERKREFERLALELDHQTRLSQDERLRKSRETISSLDKEVQARLRLTAEAIPTAISRRDEGLLELLATSSPVTQRESRGDRVTFEWIGKRYHLGSPHPSSENGEPISLDHPAVLELIGRAKSLDDGLVFEAPHANGAWHLYRVSVCGLECEDRLIILGPGGRDGLLKVLKELGDLHATQTPPTHQKELEEALDHLRDEIEEGQRPQIQRLRAIYEYRRSDTRRCLELRQTELDGAIALWTRKTIMAKTQVERRQAETKQMRLRQELEELRATWNDRLHEASREVDVELHSIDDREFVQLEAKRLFSLVGKAL